MTNFEFCTPTKIIFGRGVLSRLGEEASLWGKKALFLYGKGSLKRSGLYDQIKKQLSDAGIEVVEHGGVEPNPLLEHAEAGAEICRRDGVDFILAAGGGSVIDESKAIACGAMNDEPLWDYFSCKAPVKAALPVMAIQTQPATSSDNNPVSVMTNPASGEKFGLRSPFLAPKVSFLDPEITFTIPLAYTSYACFDMVSHLTEGYFNTTATFSPVQDGFTEGLVKAVMASFERVRQDPEDYDGRASLLWAGALNWNGLVNAGLDGAVIPCHMLEHPMSALYNVAHGAGLSIVTPAWLKFKKDDIAPRIIRFGRNILGMEDLNEGDGISASCDRVIEKFETWIRSIGCPLTFTEAGISNPDIDALADQAVKLAGIWNIKNYSKDKIKKVYYSCI
ncbi:MAG: iron-containing alcohol dehydrogenase [Spirochaetales bacterium]|nr:iron-containing alcohol dehydrogenase [Spirochaetales bacterium]